MDPIKKGELTEARGFKALEELRDEYPEFVLSVRRSSPELDARGIDALTRISIKRSSKKSKKWMTVPIEFKSSRWGVEKWKVVHSDLHNGRVLIFYIPEDMSPRKTRRLMYRALMKVQKNSKDGMLYHSLFQRIFRGGSKKLRRNIALIRERRQKSRY